MTAAQTIRHYVVHGHVQGVGFRYATQQQARSMGIGGRVRNRADGAVEITAVGESTRLDELESWLRQGPPSAQVDRLERTESNTETDAGTTEQPAATPATRSSIESGEFRIER